MTYDEIINWLHTSGKKEAINMKQGTGITIKNAVGIYHRDLKKKAEEIGQNSKLGIKLFDSNTYEAKILCSKIFDPQDLTPDIAEKWVCSFENSEICDSFSMGVFAKSHLAVSKITEWSQRVNSFEKRAGFITLVAYCRINKEAGNEVFEAFLPIIKRGAKDKRPQVKHAVDWALRSIGRRNEDLRKSAINVAYQMIQHGSKPEKSMGRRVVEVLQSSDIKVLGYPRENLMGEK